MAAFGVSAIHPVASRAHTFGHASAATGINFKILSQSADTSMLWRTHGDGDVIPGPEPTADLATTATDGFVYVRTCNGVPTGTPTHAASGRAPCVVDRSNNRAYFYVGGSWRYAALT